MMSIQSAFSSGKAALRRGAFGVAMAASLFGANAAQASEFSQQECGIILASSSTVIGVLAAEYPGSLSPLFTQSLASFIAPSNPEPIHRIILEGNFRELAASKADADMQLKRAIIPTITCDGPAAIVTPAIDDVAAYMTLRGQLAVNKPPIALQERGVRQVEGPVATTASLSP